WDEYNVTEDCDLGIRLHERGWRTRILESTTWEQACCHLPAWLRQRSRWVKGYIQTYLVHTRDLPGLHRQLGFWDTLQFDLLIGGTFVSLLLNPLYWLLTLFWLCLRPEGGEYFFPLPIFLMSAFCLFIGNFVFIYTAVLACLRRGVGHLAKTCLTMPVYWLLMSIGAWKGACQLLWKAHFWEKTAHASNPDAATVTATAPVGTPPARPAGKAVSGQTNRKSGDQSKTVPKSKTSTWPGVVVTAVLLVLGVMLYQGMSFEALPEMRFHQLVASYLEAGHLWGSHALVGIASIPPLPTLALLIFHSLGKILHLDGIRLFCVLCQLGCLWQLFRWFAEIKKKQNLLMLIPLLLWAAATGAVKDISLQNPAWLGTLLLCTAWRHLAVWEETRLAKPLIPLALCTGALTLCGPGALALSACLLLLLSVAIRTDKNHDPHGLLTLLWMPWTYTVAVMLLWNWLLFGDMLFFLRETLATEPEISCPFPGSWPALLHQRWFAALALLAFLTAFTRRPWSSATLLMTATALFFCGNWTACGQGFLLGASVILPLATLLQLLLAKL
ncbi:MAG: hypothetical protein J6866_01675, partial [Victivallales bacterium]|nr:hypothetical protein [Victivallales bacterium]